MEIIKGVAIEVVFYHHGLIEKLFSQTHQVLTGFRKIDPLSLYIDELDLELKLQCLDLLSDCRLCYAKFSEAKLKLVSLATKVKRDYMLGIDMRKTHLVEF